MPAKEVKQPVVKAVQDSHGTMFSFKCPYCKRARNTRKAGEFHCSCGKTTTIQG